jgi:hypothetical protein
MHRGAPFGLGSGTLGIGQRLTGRLGIRGVENLAESARSRGRLRNMVVAGGLAGWIGYHWTSLNYLTSPTIEKSWSSTNFRTLPL